MKELLITSGYPRSGSTYLNQALNLLYYPEHEVNTNRHTVVAIEQASHIMVTFRNPIDSIASWHKYPSRGELQSDINFYIRFYSAVLNNTHKIILMDFDYFTKDINYIKDKVSNGFNFTAVQDVTDSQVKDAMLLNNKEINLPRNNKDELDLIKSSLSDFSNFSRCLELYQELKTL